MNQAEPYKKNVKLIPGGKYLTAIIDCQGPGNIGSPFKKFRNIADKEQEIREFLSFAKKFPGARWVNFYYKKRPGQQKGDFKERRYL